MLNPGPLKGNLGKTQLVSAETRSQTRTGIVGLAVLGIAAVLLVLPFQFSDELITRLRLPVIYEIAVGVVIFVAAALVLLTQTLTGAEQD